MARANVELLKIHPLRQLVRSTAWRSRDEKTSLESVIAQTSAYERHRAIPLQPPTPVAIEQAVPCTCLVM